jgi:hypothetical protein
MAFRTGHSYTVPGKGTTVVGRKGAKTYSGKGSAPAGTRKVPERDYSQVPTVTTSPSGEVTTSGFGSERAARRAKRASRAARRSARRKTLALSLIRQDAAQRRRAAASTSTRSASKRSTTANRAASSASRQQVSSAPKFSPAPKPSSKPLKFQGRKTAGTPSLKELQVASSRGTLKTNKRGYLTTPAVRKAAGAVRRLEAKARRGSSGPLPGLTPQASQVARKVLARGEKADATRKEKLAAAETGLVESDFENLPGGDADSEGWRQERRMYYPNPRNVKASAGRFFAETASAGRGRGETAGALAQSVQRSAFPERYDERKPEANAILKAYERGSLKPAQRAKLREARAEASRLGLKGLTKGKQPRKGRVPSVVYIGHQAEKKFGLTVGENPAFGGVAPVHVSGSYHYQRDRKGRGEAIDVSGDPEKMLAFDHWVAQKWGKGITELFYDPGISIKEGAEIGGIGGHEDHVHVAEAMPGQSFEGGFTAGPGGAVFVGYGSTASAAASSAASAARAAGKGEARRVSPWKRYWRIKGRLVQAGVGVEQAKPAGEEATSKTLKELERRYGVKTG